MIARQTRAERFIAAVTMLGAYVEHSPSGTGIHVIARARPLTEADDKRKDHVEIYTDKRFFTLTGQHNGSCGALLPDITGQVSELRTAVGMGVKHHVAARPMAAAATGARDWATLPVSVRTAIQRLLQRDEKARRLWVGDLSDYAGDHSGADLAFIGKILRAGATAEEADMAMRASKLYREKWDARRGAMNYGQLTLAKAAGGAPEPAIAAATSLASSQSAVVAAMKNEGMIR